MTNGTSDKNSILSAFTECRASLKRFIKRYIHRQDNAEDILQEAFLRTYRADQKTDIKNPKAYMYRTAKNLAIRENTKMSTRLTIYIEDYSGPMFSSSEPSAYEQMSAKEDWLSLKRAIDTLPPKCKKVTILRLIHGMALKEIALEMGISLSTTEKHIAKGLERCDTYMRLHRDETHLLKRLQR